jgi:hypothetical protein
MPCTVTWMLIWFIDLNEIVWFCVSYYRYSRFIQRAVVLVKWLLVIDRQAIYIVRNAYTYV